MSRSSLDRQREGTIQCGICPAWIKPDGIHYHMRAKHPDLAPSPLPNTTPVSKRGAKARKRLLLRLVEEQDGHCAYCDILMSYDAAAAFHPTLDHVIPLHAGGPDTEENVVAACHQCNRIKGCLTPDQLRRMAKRIEQLSTRSERMSRVYLAKVGDTEKLIEAGNINAARNHVAKSVITIGLASQADLFRLAKGGAEIEQAGDETPPQQEPEVQPEGGEGDGGAKSKK